MVDLIATPDLVKNEYALDSALFFFTDNEIWEIADNGTTDSIVRAVTKKVNGGTNGLADRIKLFKLFYSILK
jgi:putative chitinase